jgi:SMI1-KNR4 cell-wall
MTKRRRVIGTTASCIEDAEKQLRFAFPPSFRTWLLENNGMQISSVSIFPVFDPRDPRTTANSIVSEYTGNWQSWLRDVIGKADEFAFLLPFGSFGTGDYYCFDYRSTVASGEVPVILWDHETGECEYRAPDFATFVERLANGEFPEA